MLQSINKVKQYLLQQKWFLSIKGLFKINYGSGLIILSTLLTLELLTISGKGSPSNISDSILALTAMVILWYTYETSEMKHELAKQSKLQTRPLINLNLDKSQNRALLKNIGNGPALNVKVINFDVSSFLSKIEARKRFFEISPIVIIPKDCEEQFICFWTEDITGRTGTIPLGADYFSRLTTLIDITIQYEDLERSTYFTRLQIKSGMPQIINVC